MLISTFPVSFPLATAMVQKIFTGYLVNHSSRSHDKLQQLWPPIFKYKSRDASSSCFPILTQAISYVVYYILLFTGKRLKDHA